MNCGLFRPLLLGRRSALWKFYFPKCLRPTQNNFSALDAEFRRQGFPYSHLAIAYPLLLAGALGTITRNFITSVYYLRKVLKIILQVSSPVFSWVYRTTFCGIVRTSASPNVLYVYSATPKFLIQICCGAGNCKRSGASSRNVLSAFLPSMSYTVITLLMARLPRLHVSTSQLVKGLGKHHGRK